MSEAGRWQVNPAVILPFIIELLQAAPEIVSDVEKIVAAFKGNPDPVAAGSLAKQMITDTQALVEKLEGK